LVFPHYGKAELLKALQNYALRSDLREIIWIIVKERKICGLIPVD
jgi:hypothetical protein